MMQNYDKQKQKMGIYKKINKTDLEMIESDKVFAKIYP